MTFDVREDIAKQEMVPLPYIYRGSLPTPKISCRNLYNAKTVSAGSRHAYGCTRYFEMPLQTPNWQFFLRFCILQLVKTTTPFKVYT